MKKLKLCACVLAVLLLLSSCSISRFDTDSMLVPPQMNAVNQQIKKALSSEIGSAYELVYPKSGDYQNAIIAIDLNGNGVNEAICFYNSGQDKKIGFMILENQNDRWVAKTKISSDSKAIDRVDFFDYDGDGTKEIIMGWQYLQSDEKALEIYNYNDSDVKSIFTGLYTNFIVFKNSVITISRNTTGKTSTASLVGKRGKIVDILGTASLNSSITAITQVQSSKISNEYSVVYIDEQLENSLFTTEILTINSSGDLSNISTRISSLTTRNTAINCTDINGNGIYDIPVEKAFPSYKNGDKTENLYYYEWYGIGKTTEPQLILNAYSSANEKFLITLPNEWIGSITVQKDSANDREIHFYMIGDEGNLPMFSFRVFSQQEFSDQIRSLGWYSVAEANENVYAFKPRLIAEEKFRVDLERFTQLFTLL